MYKIGDMVEICDDNECYMKFRNKVLIVTHIATNKHEHPGYDESMNGMQLMDFVTNKGKTVPFSLYEYEITKI